METTENQPAVEVTDLAYDFPGAETLSLRVPGLAIATREHTAIVGPSGCGKTTLLRLIVGVLVPKKGTVRTLGIETATLGRAARGRERLRSIGMVFQNFALLEYISALENIVLTARLGGLSLPDARERAHDLATRAGIAHTLGRRPRRLSQGEQQRIAVCRALVTRPRLIVCDEPTGNLDPARSGEIIALVRSEADAIGGHGSRGHPRPRRARELRSHRRTRIDRIARTGAAVILLSLRHAASYWARSLLLFACVFVITALPLVSRSVAASFERSMLSRASTVPLLVGAAGSRFDLSLAALHWRVSDIATIELGVVEEIASEPGVVALPVHARYSARGETIAAVPFEYFGFRGLALREGRLVAQLGDAVLGAKAARKLRLAPGDELPSDQRRSYDITAPPSVVLTIVGVLAETGTPDDDAVFVDLKTAWLLEGISHGHQDASAITDPEKVIGRSDERVALSGAVVEHQRVDGGNADSFHLHGDRQDLPITAVLVIPSTDKSAALVRTRINADAARQAISPTDVAEELVGSVLRVRALVDTISLVVGVAMLGLLALVGMLTLRARSDEIRTLRDVGASNGQIAALFLVEFVGICLVAIVGAIWAASAASGQADRALALLA